MTDKVPAIFGEVLFDCFADGSRVLGGAPFNVAWHLQAFGAQPMLISRVGDDPPAREIRGRMQDWGMRTAGLQKDSAHFTGRVDITIADGEPSYDIVHPVAWDFIDPSVLPPMRPALLYHGSLAARNPDSLAALDALKRRHAVPIFLDVNLRPPWGQRERVLTLLRDATWAKLNQDEVMELSDGAGSPEAMARTLIERFDLDLLILTRGSQGALGITPNGMEAEAKPAPALDVIDTVGAGDAFASVCILGLLNDWDLQTTFERAQTFASRIVGTRGATIGDKGLYAEIRASWGL